MPNTHSTLTSLFSDIADAIRGKTGSSATIVADDFPTAIANIPTGSSGLADAVRFIDYDGTILHTYSANEFAALNAMPANPSHTGLTAQGWNWTLADAKALVADYGVLDIGQMYVTDDGKTRIYISLTDSARLSPYLGIALNGTAVVDWGDNTATDLLTGTSLSTLLRTQHTYASTGDYVITLEVTSGAFYITGISSSTTGSCLLTLTSGAGNQQCFQNAIQKVELGANASLYYYAFQKCYSLKSITIPSTGVTRFAFNVFKDCYSLKSVTIPSGVDSIGESVFENCYSLLNVSIPRSVTTLNSYVFHECYTITRITLPNAVTSLGASVFNNCYSATIISVPRTVTRTGSSAFSGCNSLTSFPELSGLTSISSSYAFASIRAFTSFTIPSGVTSISTHAFDGCCLLTSVTIPNSVTSLGTYAFQNCYKLTNITLPSNITTLPDYLFYYCYSLPSITIPSSVTTIGTAVFGGCTFSTISLPSGLTKIGSSAFSGCYNLNNITIPSSVTSILAGAFNACNSLTNITIPSGVTNIADATFRYCYSLASITIPSGVTAIASNAFYQCYGMAEYHLLPTTPPTLGATNAFTGIAADCKIYVPYSADHSILEAYQTATNWVTYASHMVEESP